MAITMTPNSAKALPGAVLVSRSEGGTALKTVESEALSTRSLFESYAGFVLRTVRRLGVRPSDTEDVTQEIFMIAHRRIADRHADVHPRSWLFGIARRVVANYLRKVHRLREQLSDDVATVASSDPAQELQLTRERALLERALGRLDSEKREVFVLFELEGLSMHEVAQTVGCPLNTAYSRLYAARALVQRHVHVSGARSER